MMLTTWAGSRVDVRGRLWPRWALGWIRGGWWRGRFMRAHMHGEHEGLSLLDHDAWCCSMCKSAAYGRTLTILD